MHQKERQHKVSQATTTTKTKSSSSQASQARQQVRTKAWPNQLHPQPIRSQRSRLPQELQRKKAVLEAKALAAKKKRAQQAAAEAGRSTPKAKATAKPVSVKKTTPSRTKVATTPQGTTRPPKSPKPALQASQVQPRVAGPVKATVPMKAAVVAPKKEEFTSYAMSDHEGDTYVGCGCACCDIEAKADQQSDHHTPDRIVKMTRMTPRSLAGHAVTSSGAPSRCSLAPTAPTLTRSSQKLSPVTCKVRIVGTPARPDTS